MGTQISIEISDLEAAGWNCNYITEQEFSWCNDLQEYVCDGERLLLEISKDNWKFISYCHDSFFADCNTWGTNIHLFKEAGLFNIKYSLV